ncbi:hypothetical protein FLA105534_04690 [Flavobacterium bizetiae]|uniref:DUF4838 domain-containing protein n=1 Tax=Flavobacterium bizetiae TaxID=2704140 RepID=A0A6J4GYL2_9FLAO|nr:DUF4838 domain-containing protein [Flavobacterium bizetiae]CAA9203510.1 hypothetical protein FLA105534_04690 [Flavobacterium bizetiae]CAD5344356.1 hypothetical protein FLA105535_04362 [Flavobacterium bizetiae]CAD5350420.1 hypothetical protein FLA105534_04410 [Flavobacterium bizetiae]
MAQSEIIITDANKIVPTSENAQQAARVLKYYLDKAFAKPFEITAESQQESNASQIILSISVTEKLKPNEFKIKSDSKSIYLIAPNQKYLRYAVFTLLEIWEFRKFTASETYIPKVTQLTFAKNTQKIHEPSFDYRALFYPDCYDEDFRDWHKLDWQVDDFGIWGHSFSVLVPAKEYFKTNPKLFALYEGERNAESLCMSNDTVVELVEKKMAQIIAEKPNAQFYSVSQNDDVVYCECTQCKALNKKHDGPQGSFYYFLNKIAAHFPKTKITTLAYLHTFKPPVNLKIESNIYTIFCPIELNRGKAITSENAPSFVKTLENWSVTSPHLFLWDYTVQFSNYMSPFPNFESFQGNYKLFKKNKVKGLFVQGYSDIAGDFSELRQYLLAKLMWNTDIDVEATTADFLRGFYGKAAPFVGRYLNLLETNQKKSNTYLDIYSSPVDARNTFLTPEAMDQYDQLLEQASGAVENDSVLSSRIQKLRLALEYVYFEQAKFYGKNQHGMFIVNSKGEKIVREGLTERVLKFTKACNQFGIYELSEGGLSPDNYYKEWLEICKNTVTHLGEDLKVSFITPPSDEFKGKGSYGLVDGNRGYKDFNINWIGWYENNPEIEIETKKLDFNILKINFLNDQRHWIFLPKKIKVYGFKDQKWQLLQEKICDNLTEDFEITTKSWEFEDQSFSSFAKIKVIVENQTAVPNWRKRKNKKPMVMLDEIELYKK